MPDNAPVFAEFGYLAATCSGDMTGCAVCATASVLRRYGKPVPLATDPRDGDLTLNARELGRVMGARHRAEAPAGTPGDRHGLSLSGHCSPPQTGTNWCARCVYLELRARGLPAIYVKPSDATLAAHLKASHSVVTPGWYGRIPVVSQSSYSSTVPARGRSDAGFEGWHMVVAHGVILYASGAIKHVIVSDADFGSSARPVVPPHSLWTWTQYLAYYRATGGWSVAIVNAKPPAAQPPPAPAPGAEPVYRVAITGPTRIYDHINGDLLGTIRKATYACHRRQSTSTGKWWFTILNAHRHGQAFQPNAHTKAVRA